MPSLRSLTKLLDIVSLNPRSFDAMWVRLADGLGVTPQFIEELRWPVPADTPRRWMMFLGQEVHESYLHLSVMRLCTRCVDETESLDSLWSLKHVTACHRHQRRLREACPGCGKGLKLHSHFCWTCTECGSDFRDGPDEPADEHEVRIASGLAAAITNERLPAAVAERFPPAWHSGSLQERLTTIEYLGRLVRLSADDTIPARLRREYLLIAVDPHVPVEDLRERTRVAAAILRRWPEAFEELLEALIDRNPTPTTSNPLLRRFSTAAGSYAVRGLKSRTGEDMSLLSTARLDFLQRRLNYRPRGRNLLHRFAAGGEDNRAAGSNILSSTRVEQLLSTNETGLKMLQKAEAIQPLNLRTRLLAWNGDDIEALQARLSALPPLPRSKAGLVSPVIVSRTQKMSRYYPAHSLWRDILSGTLPAFSDGPTLDRVWITRSDFDYMISIHHLRHWIEDQAYRELQYFNPHATRIWGRWGATLCARRCSSSPRANSSASTLNIESTVHGRRAGSASATWFDTSKQ
jgi:ribosomal protein L37AE/L43A